MEILEKCLEKKASGVQSSNHSQFVFEAVSFRRLLFLRSGFCRAAGSFNFGKKRKPKILTRHSVAIGEKKVLFIVRGF